MRRHGSGNESQLELALVRLGRSIDFADPGDPALFAEAVARRLREESSLGRVISLPATSPPRAVPGFRMAWRNVAVASAAVVVLVAGLLAFSPDARRAVAGWLGIRGVQIEPRRELPPVALGSGLQLGERTTLAMARAEIDFPITLPARADLGTPDEVYVTEIVGGVPQVSLLYRERPGFPRAAQTGAALLITQFRAELDEELLYKKVVVDESDVEAVRINGRPGFWIGGRPHVLYFLGPNEEPIADSVRLAGNVLLWEMGDVTMRLESALSKDEAVRVAESIR